MAKVVVLGRAARLQLSLTAEQHQLFLAGKDYKIISEWLRFHISPLQIALFASKQPNLQQIVQNHSSNKLQCTCRCKSAMWLGPKYVFHFTLFFGSQKGSYTSSKLQLLQTHHDGSWLARPFRSAKEEYRHSRHIIWDSCLAKATHGIRAKANIQSWGEPASKMW